MSTLNADTTLGDLGLDSLMGVEVKQTLERDYDLSLPMREIRLLTINKLNAITGGAGGAQSPTDESSSNDSAYQSFASKSENLRYDANNLMPTESIVKMTDGLEGHTTDHPLFVVHPIEGSVISMETVMQQVQSPVYGLQCTVDAPLTSISDLAAFYIKVRSFILFTAISSLGSRDFALLAETPGCSEARTIPFGWVLIRSMCGL